MAMGSGKIPVMSLQVNVPDWQIPPGLDRGAWDYVHNPELAKHYDAALTGTPLLRQDLAFCDVVFATPGRVVDLGCGTGRLCLHLQTRGFTCTAIDFSEEMLAVLQSKPGAQNIKTIHANLVELEGVPGPFDYAACLFSTYGMIRGRDNRLRFLSHVKRLLTPAGCFVLHAHNRGPYVGGWRTRYRDWLAKWRKQEPGEYPVPQHYGGAPLTLRHFRAAEIRAELSAAGFRVTHWQAVDADGGQVTRDAAAYGFLIACMQESIHGPE
jgi:SAM-dependent methyltransferase